MAETPTSPKVTATSLTVATAALIMYLLSQWSFVEQMPEGVKGSLLVVVLGGLAHAAGWLKGDPLRQPSPPAQNRRRNGQ